MGWAGSGDPRPNSDSGWWGSRWPKEAVEIGCLNAELGKWVVEAVFFFEELHRAAEVAGGAAAVAGGADVVLERAADAFFEAVVFERVGDFAADDVEHFAHELPGLTSSEGARFGTGETFGESTFEHPGGGARVGADGLLHRAERAELGVGFGAAELVAEVGISFAFAADGSDAAMDVAGGFAQAAAAGDEGADFAALGVVENARSAGAVEFGAFGALVGRLGGGIGG